ncbi:hypothetical protein GJ633_09360 [Halorubrum sp. CBA1125]|uniref:hypothetical protein n=1 Tax=Halorubrum sp. CBA1125 TaxID=2668072 RepID=UPI0012E87DCF|nr:hypothetical protein [Halorubrum sp. CBA1125]MUW14847.1 hypothetical protein [Halorubrum sp. CBA1125]
MSGSVTGHATGRAEIDTDGATADVELLTGGVGGVISLGIDAGVGEMNILLDADDAQQLAKELTSNAMRLREVNDE